MIFHSYVSLPEDTTLNPLHFAAARPLRVLVALLCSVLHWVIFGRRRRSGCVMAKVFLGRPLGYGLYRGLAQRSLNYLYHSCFTKKCRATNQFTSQGYKPHQILETSMIYPSYHSFKIHFVGFLVYPGPQDWTWTKTGGWSASLELVLTHTNLSITKVYNG